MSTGFCCYNMEMEPNKRDYDFLAGGEVDVRKDGKLVFRPMAEQIQTTVEESPKKKKPRNAKAPEKIVPKVYVNLSLKKVD